MPSMLFRRTETAPSGPQLTYDREGAARELAIGITKLWQLTCSGELESFKIGTKRLYRREALEDFIKRQNPERT